MLKAYKYRMYPKPKQEVLLAKHFGCTRFIYNWALDQKIKKYQIENKSLSCFDLINQLVQLKTSEATKWLSEVNSQSLQSAIVHLDKAFTRFFREKKGFPKFKNKHKRQSFACPQNVKIDWHNSTTKLPKIGEVKTVFSRQFDGKIKTCTISKTRTNKYFVSILIDDGKSTPKPVPIRKETAIGIDLGIKDFAITSNGEKISNPKYLREAEIRLAVLQKQASRKVKGSNNRKKANFRVAKQHEKITNKRIDFLHKVSTKLIRENQTICLETLNVAGMMKNHCLAKSIADVSWSKFVEFLTYKAEWLGHNIVRIGRFEASSKTCSVCGNVKRDLMLKDREWTCSGCRTCHDRDVNAAKNIRNFALQKQNLIGTNSGKGIPGEPLESLSLDRAMKEESPWVYHGEDVKSA
jgi:putative transposase